jgi:hypothetical protein
MINRESFIATLRYNMYTGRDLDWFFFVIAAQAMFVERNTITTRTRPIFKGFLKKNNKIKTS